eukprot:1158274-Pelagomonas_calceolata.AAC.59
MMHLVIPRISAWSMKSLRKGKGYIAKERKKDYARQVWPRALRKGHLKGTAPPYRPRGTLLRRLISTLITEIRQGVLLVPLLTPIDLFLFLLVKEKLPRQKKHRSISMKEKKTCWLRTAVSLLHHKATDLKELMGSEGLLEAPGSRTSSCQVGWENDPYFSW